MPGGFFNFFSGKDDTPPAPEKRRVPDFAKDIQNPLDGWITSQVFVDKKDKSKRVYYAAQTFADGEWVVAKYTYSSVSDHDCLKEEPLNEVHNIETATRAVAKHEKRILEEGYTPIPSLKGNYREAANQNGAYIDDKGNYIAVAKDKPLAKDAVFSRKGISAIYGKAADKSTEAPIKTWDDFYREIVRAPIAGIEDPAGYLLNEGAPLEHITHLPEVARAVKDTLAEVKSFSQKMLDGRYSLETKKSFLSFVNENAYYRAAEGTRWARDATAWHYELIRLTVILRVGAKIFQGFASSLTASGETVELLEAIGTLAKNFSESRLHFLPERAKQITALITLGPDPYADKPLPLEEVVANFLNTPKPDPKGPGL